MQPLRRRAGVVCVQCHARKIKCDLQQRQQGPCLNCLKTNQPCQRRRGLRKEGKHRSINAARLSLSLPEPQLSRRSERETLSRPAIGSGDCFVGYLAEESFLSNNCGLEDSEIPPQQRLAPKEPSLMGDATLTLPPKPLLNAFIDEYFRNIYPLIPVIDRCDVAGESTSVLLLQCLSMLGSHFRGPRQPHIPTAETSYQKAKALLSQNYERDPLTTLRCLCLIACRAAESPTAVSLDSPWHWHGVATRYAFNMGLHRESTYRNKRSAGVSRRIWWNLFNQDKLQSLCYGRPPAIRLREIDVQPPTLQDFPTVHLDHEIFLQRTKICVILGKISDVQYGRDQRSIIDEVPSIGRHLKQWIRDLPEPLQLFTCDEVQDRKPYYRAVSEIHIMYFTCVILFYRLTGTSKLDFTPLKVSTVAAACTLQLMKEIYYRNDIASLLPITNWFCMVASVPICHAIVNFPNEAALYREELDMLRLILHEMIATSPSTRLILKNVDHIQRSVGTSPTPDPTSPLLADTTDPVNHNAAAQTRHSPVEPWSLFPFPETMCPCMHLLPCRVNNGDHLESPLQGVETLLTDGRLIPTEDIGEFSHTLNFDFGNIQMDEFLSDPFDDAGMLAFEPEALT